MTGRQEYDRQRTLDKYMINYAIVCEVETVRFITNVDPLLFWLNITSKHLNRPTSLLTTLIISLSNPMNIYLSL
jgi:hypothetical protein